MSYLLDTCTLFWLVTEPKKISGKARGFIQENQNNLFVSAISAFEFGVKQQKRKIKFSLSLDEWFRRALKDIGIGQIPINFQIATKSTQLPTHHSDPCDRIIIASAWEYEMKILTPDPLIKKYRQIECIW
jgi:PIN domain nuclease of toxin-antitoxin system